MACIVKCVRYNANYVSTIPMILANPGTFQVKPSDWQMRRHGFGDPAIKHCIIVYIS